jgi:hypothetical protein
MKKLILFTLAIGMIAGCSKPLVNKEIDKRIDSYAIDIYSMEGHKYITYINGGLVHAESCECKNKGGDK